MTFEAICPSCGKSAKARDEWVGKKVKCSKCKRKFQLAAPELDDDDEWEEVHIEWEEDELADINSEPDALKPKRSANLDDCPDCGNMVSKSAYSCPHCGRPLRGKAVECYLTISRDYEEGYSIRSIGMQLDGRMVGDIENGGVATLQVEPGPHRIALGLYGLMGGGWTPSLNQNFEVTEGNHLVLTFSPCGGFMGTTFVCEWSEKID